MPPRSVGTDRGGDRSVSLRRALVQVSISDFRQIAEPGDRGKKERLFRAAIAAFCSLTRPSRNEIAKLEDLTLPLYEGVSAESLRFVAAALSEVEHAPHALILRLADESVEIAAPLLLRSKALTDIDLIALIGRRGLAHARVIARRPTLNPTIAALVRALNRAELKMVHNDRLEREEEMKPLQPAAPAAAVHGAEMVVPRRADREAPALGRPGGAAETVRDKLRAMMEPAARPATRAATLRPESRDMPEWVAEEFAAWPRPGAYEKLKGTALTGNRLLFQTALADALAVQFSQAQAITGPAALGDLLAALKFLALPEEHAFVIAAALHPSAFGHAEAIRLFLRRYHLIHREAAADKVRGWKEATLAAALTREPPAEAAFPREPANSPGRPVFGTARKVS